LSGYAIIVHVLEKVLARQFLDSLERPNRLSMWATFHFLPDLPRKLDLDVPVSERGQSERSVLGRAVRVADTDVEIVHEMDHCRQRLLVGRFPQARSLSTRSLISGRLSAKELSFSNFALPRSADQSG
jgi:hypothetical protein